MRILIANRGEIARRVIRTASALGHDTVAVYADPDVLAPHVAEATCSYRIGPAPLAESYLSVERLLAAAKETAADAVHPGLRLPLRERPLRPSGARHRPRMDRPFFPGHHRNGFQDRGPTTGEVCWGSRDPRFCRVPE